MHRPWTDVEWRIRKICKIHPAPLIFNFFIFSQFQRLPYPARGEKQCVKYVYEEHGFAESAEELNAWNAAAAAEVAVAKIALPPRVKISEDEVDPMIVYRL